ncbi:MAG TPA: ABC transporter ATP-binding protein [Solirubrobacteraceae bacterium]|nr:ABC transporter ATP-binding protein [Solirubrobacteraceae bacterium]
MPETLLKVEHLTKSFHTRSGTNHAIGDLTFELHKGEFLVMVGPSGCGKTTLLRCVSGLIAADSGQRIVADGTRAGIPNSIAIVFQEYSRSLFPWLTVAKNVAFGLTDLTRTERQERVAEALQMVGLSGFENQHPWQLSGGMQQRVAIARAVARRPSLLLMDEPFASIDAQMRVSLEAMVAELWEQLGLSVVFVTHDIDEAVLLADRILVLSNRPSRVIREIPIELPRPRDPVETKADPMFSKYRREIFDLLGPLARAAGSNPKPLEEEES